jgi:hypothetical protein
MRTQDLSLRDQADVLAVKLQDILDAVTTQTKTVAKDCDWEVLVSGTFGLGTPILGGQVQFNASFRLTSRPPN